MSVPSLVNICLDFLAENAGYIVDLDGVPSQAVLEICTRSSAFGLVNLESVLSDSIARGDLSVSGLWAELTSKVASEQPSFLIKKVPIGPCDDYQRQVYTASLLRKQTTTPFLEPEDFDLLLQNAGRFLAFAEMHTSPALWLTPCFTYLKTLRFLDISQANIGADGAASLRIFILESQWLQGVDASRNRLGVPGAQQLSEAILGSGSLLRVNLAFNGFGLEGVKTLLEAVAASRGVAEADLSRNLFGKDVAAGFRVRKAMKLPRPINININ